MEEVVDEDCPQGDDNVEGGDWPERAEEDAASILMRLDMEEQWFANRTDAEWLDELTEGDALVREALEALVTGGANRARLVSELRELEALASRPLSKTTPRQFERLVETLKKAEEQYSQFIWTDGPWCLPASARHALEVVGLTRLTVELKAFQARFPAALGRQRRAAADLQSQITRSVDMRMKPRGKVGKQKQHAALAALFAAVTLKGRSIHAQRVATARGRTNTPGLTAPPTRKTGRFGDSQKTKRRRRSPFVEP